jgi:hypothetical protein
MDGAALVDGDSEPTVVLGQSESSVPTVEAGSPGTSAYRRPVPPTVPSGRPAAVVASGKKRRGGSSVLWIGLVVLVIFLSVGALLAVLLYNSYRNDRVRVDVPGNAAGSPSPKRSATPRPSPSPANTEAATPAAAKTDNDSSDETDEITPIAWTTAASGFKNDVGQIYRFECPAGGTSSAVWGSDIYTADSSICTAAVHAGKIGFEDGGIVTIEYRPGRQIYGSTARNGVTSNTFGEYPKSFVFK